MPEILFIYLNIISQIHSRRTRFNTLKMSFYRRIPFASGDRSSLWIKDSSIVHKSLFLLTNSTLSVALFHPGCNYWIARPSQPEPEPEPHALHIGKNNKIMCFSNTFLHTRPASFAFLPSIHSASERAVDGVANPTTWCWLPRFSFNILPPPPSIHSRPPAPSQFLTCPSIVFVIFLLPCCPAFCFTTSALCDQLLGLIRALGEQHTLNVLLYVCVVCSPDSLPTHRSLWLAGCSIHRLYL